MTVFPIQLCAHIHANASTVVCQGGRFSRRILAVGEGVKEDPSGSNKEGPAPSWLFWTPLHQKTQKGKSATSGS